MMVGPRSVFWGLPIILEGRSKLSSILPLGFLK